MAKDGRELVHETGTGLVNYTGLNKENRYFCLEDYRYFGLLLLGL